MQPLIACQLDVLYVRDRAGRLVGTRDVEPRSAPRLHLGRSAERTVWALHQGLEARLAEAVAAACAMEPPLSVPAPDRAPSCRERVLELLGSVAVEFRGPAFVLSTDLPEDSRARILTAREAGACRGVFPWIEAEFRWIQPVAVAFDNGHPASVCHSPRGWTDVVAEAGVETCEAFRNRGLATAAVACWARAVQRTGCRALYSTSWENHASRAVAEHLSAAVYGEDWHVA